VPRALSLAAREASALADCFRLKDRFTTLLDRGAAKTMKIGDWVVTPTLNQLERDGRTLKVEPRSMELLVCLARHAGNVVSTDQLIAEVWNGRVIEESGVYKQINQLRTALGDEAQRPRFIETIPKRGYRLIAPVERAGDACGAPPAETPGPEPKTPRFISRYRYSLAAGLLVVIVAVAVAAWELTPASRIASDRGAASGAPPPNSIVVLPFDNLSPDPKDAYFAFSMGDQILTELTELGGLRVASRQSAAGYAGTQKSAAQIARELGVAAVLDGTVSYADGSVRVTAHLSDGATNEIRWSGSYQHELSNIFAIQSDIALEVAKALKAELSPEERERVTRLPTTSMPAYQLYLQASARRWSDSSEGNRSAISEVEQALDLSPDFTAAWVLDSHARTVAVYYDPEHTAEHLARGKQAARRALELDPELGDAHGALAFALSLEPDWVGSEAEYREALRRHVSLADASDAAYPILLLSVGHFARAREFLEEGRRVEPWNTITLRFLVFADAYLGDWQLASAQIDTGTRVFTPWRQREDFVHLMVDHHELERARAISAPGSIHPAMIANVDNPQVALSELRHRYADPTAARLPRDRRDIAAWAAHFGDPGLALDAMRSAVSDQAGQAVFLWLPQFREMRRLPAFKAWLRDIGIVAYWKQYGWPAICRPGRSDDDFECG
jgi:DNA-binding winged helix-turn-helix (wHTH) protein/TolB-like protein